MSTPEPTTVRFTGTVIACGTRWSTPWEEAIALAEPAPSWVVTIDVDSADPGAPYAAGTRGSLLFHSPTHVFVFVMTSSEDAHTWALNRRFRFALDRGPSNFTNLRAELTLPSGTAPSP
jgi:hypothetical protein